MKIKIEFKDGPSVLRCGLNLAGSVAWRSSASVRIAQKLLLKQIAHDLRMSVILVTDDSGLVVWRQDATMSSTKVDGLNAEG